VPELWTVGERIETLLDASSAHGALARERSEELVRLVTDLYGAGLERMLEILYEAGALSPDGLSALAADELVSGLLLVHGLHPYDLRTRVGRALTDLGPTLAGQSAHVSRIAVDEAGDVHVTLGGDVSGCGTAALIQSVETAVQTAAPDAGRVRVDVESGPRGPSLIPVSSLRSRLSQVGP
jgi:Fe-S cluster biogenesis protein NfuA